MNKIQSAFNGINNRIPKITTPAAIIIGSIIVAVSIVAYGYIVRQVGEVTRDFVKEIAKELRLKGSKWETCLASKEAADQVEKEFKDGTMVGVTGTPTTFILVKKNGVYQTAAKIVGAQPENVVVTAINDALAGKSKTEPFLGMQIDDKELMSGTRSDVVLVEYADAECPFCVRFHPTILSVTETYGDRIGYVYRHFPLTNIHPNAVPYAVAIECAGKLKGEDVYFGFINRLMAKQAEGQ